MLDMDGMNQQPTADVAQLVDYDYCWIPGIYTDQNCEECPHYSECSGSREEDD